MTLDRTSIPLQPAGKLGLARFDDNWASLTHLGNQAFSDHEFKRAQKMYALALNEAKKILVDAKDGQADLYPHCPPMLIVSAGNAARTYQQQGHMRAAADQLQSAVSLFVEVIGATDLPPMLRQAFAEHLPRLTHELEQLVIGNNKAALASIENAKQTALSFWREASH